ncbi:MAG: HypC/HybG/HupF family hydrogenase formation chaperone [Candidatus Odinarchaeum yellowstonii]|jgi:hydrogenase expression/formation protein HypC|uniref:HypC/HybG/HupF family hydrogenase formation chaperone n=1 Tax=Odinarchaeota yellowstonii (strain LCB_4) TaxID=1841599 RepID=A0AAF0IBT5_ODILC|nr:MAG: HypC/HybG/HupF family hydrogenase formation chaperone [Candidatus Odinarchaeum yellowstonii]
MCLAIPGRILEINGNIAKTDFGEGIVRNVNVSLVKARVGDYIIVHAGFAIQVLNENEAKKTIKMFKDLLKISA